MTAKKALFAQIDPNLWIILPGYNERRYIARVLKKVLCFTPNVIMVDDGSSDTTAEIARNYTPYVLRHAVNLGKGAAMRTGADYAFKKLQASAVIFLDADDQHDPNELPLLAQELRNGAAVVLGVRGDLTEMPHSKVIANQLASRLIQILFGVYVPDIPSGYKAIAKQVYPTLRWQSNGYEVELEIAARLARSTIPFVPVCIQTIYHDMNKGMTVLDVLHMLHVVLSWKLSL